MAMTDVHVFGSIGGYETLSASAGLSAEERRELESFQFAQPATIEAVEQLETHAVLTCRPLRSGRIALSRMLPGGVDDADRPTVEVVTLVMSADDYLGHLGSVEELVRGAAPWRDAKRMAERGSQFALLAGAPPTSDPTDEGLARILDVWMHAKQTGSLAVLPESAWPQLLRFVATLHPADRITCRWGIGISSTSVPVDVCSAGLTSVTAGARPVVRPARPGMWHRSEADYACYLRDQASTWKQIRELVACAVAFSENPTSRVDAPSKPAAVDAPQRRARRLIAAGSATAALATLLFATSAWLVLNTRSPSVAPFAPRIASDSVGDAPPEPRNSSRNESGRRSRFGDEVPAPAPAPPPAVVPVTPPLVPAPATPLPSTAPETTPPEDPQGPPPPAPSKPSPPGKPGQGAEQTVSPDAHPPADDNEERERPELKVDPEAKKILDAVKELRRIRTLIEDRGKDGAIQTSVDDLHRMILDVCWAMLVHAEELEQKNSGNFFTREKVLALNRDVLKAWIQFIEETEETAAKVAGLSPKLDTARVDAYKTHIKSTKKLSGSGVEGLMGRFKQLLGIPNSDQRNKWKTWAQNRIKSLDTKDSNP
jgi:hypothetical protein